MKSPCGEILILIHFFLPLHMPMKRGPGVRLCGMGIDVYKSHIM
jgi:hypothetical protein